MLFVYGTLRSGGGQNWRVADGGALIGRARMAGQLYQVDLYPGMVLADAADGWVLGEVYRLWDPGGLLAELDRYEGDEYTRERGVAVMESGAAVDCWAYLFRGTVDESRRIESGDFLA